MARIGFVAALLAACLGIAAVAYQAEDVGRARAFASDFTQDYVAARALARGEDPYQPTTTLLAREFGTSRGYFEARVQPAPHPPILITAYLPFTVVGFETARLIWLWLSAFVIAAASAVVIRGVGVGPWISVFAGIGVLAIPVVQKELAYGQTNGVLLGLLVLGWAMLGRGRDLPAGIALGIAAAFKLFPLLMIVPVLRMGRTRAAVWMGATFVLASVVGAGAVGWSATERLVTEVMPDNTAYWGAAPMNTSLIGVVTRWLTARPATEEYACLLSCDPPWMSGADLPVLASVLAAMVFLGCVAGALVTPARLTGDRFWETVPWMLLASPLAWEFSLTLSVPLGALVVGRAMRVRAPPPILVMVALALVVLGIPPGLSAPENASGAEVLLAYGLPTYGLLLLALAGFRTTWGEPGARAATTGQKAYSPEP